MGASSTKSSSDTTGNWPDTSHIVNKNKFKLFCKYWEPSNDPKVLIFIAHGLGEHCQWYEHLGTEIAARGMLAFSHDHVGHGLSEGYRAYVDSFEEYTQDIIQHANMMKQQHPNIPCLIIGHSMGGLMAVRILQDNPEVFSAAVLIGPALKPNPKTASAFKVQAAKLLANVSPKFEIARIEPEWISHDPEIVKRYREDPLIYHGGLRARIVVVLLHEMEVFAKNIDKVTVPILNFHGGSDLLCEVDGSTFLHEKAPSTDKTLHILEKQFHQVHNEADGVGDKCRKDIVDWLASHI